MMDERKKKLKMAIIVLGILFLTSSAALAGTLIYKHFVSVGPSSVIVPNNIITPEQEDSSAAESQPSGEAGDTSGTQPTTRPVTLAPTEDETDETATPIYLYNRNPGDNTPFTVGNLFPGDVETKYFCVQISYQDTVTVKYHADIRPGYEKLAEVLKCKIVHLTTGETMYEGLMRDMPASLNHTLYSEGSTTDALYYGITAYLDTRVGNEYQNQELMADFRWWVEEEGSLVEPPQTGDNSHLILWFGLMCASLFMLILLFVTRKKEAQNEQY